MTLSNFLAILLIIKMLRPVSNKERFLVEVNALNKDIVWYLRNMDQRLTSTQKRLRQYLLEHTVDVGYMSLKDLSEKAQVSEVSILNFCKLVGADSYIDMRECFRNYTRDMMRNIFMEPVPPSVTQEQWSEMYHYCSDITENHNRMLQSIDLTQLEQCAKMLTSSSNILILGHDMSKVAADYLASRLSYLHIHNQSVNLGDNDTVQMLLAGLVPGDSVIIFSFPPFYMPAEDVADYVRHFGYNLIVIADNENSPVVGKGGVDFLCRAQNSYFFNSMSVPLHFAEILAYYVAAATGKRSEDIINGMNAVGSYFLHNKVKEMKG